MAKRKEKIMPFFKYLVIVLIIINVITIGLFKFIDILPSEYFMILIFLLSLITIGLSFLILAKKGPKKRALGSFLGILYIIFLVMIIIYELNTIGFLKKLGFKNYKTENYSVLVLNDSKYKEIKDLEKQKLGSIFASTDGAKKAEEKLKKMVNLEFRHFNDAGELKDSFVKKDIQAMLIENSILAMLQEDDEEFIKSYRIIEKFSIDIEIADIANHVDMTKNSFNIYISGIDTYGAISSVSRSDVNMVLSVNPNTHTILITSIPRDYYVPLRGKNGKDKLTHAGIYGVETSVGTLEDLLDIKINYYVKVNFTSLIKVVDALGGVDVYSKHKFTSRDGYSYNVGYNSVNGERALSFVRERKAFIGGDRVRVENQAAMISAIFDKAISPSIITKYNSLLSALGDSFVTNMETEAITEFIKMQLDEMSSWDILNISLDGTDAMATTYSYGKQKLYVMMPKNETVVNAQNKIKEVFG